MSTITITIDRDDAQAISDFAENMLDDAPDAKRVASAVRIIDAAIREHDQVKRVEAEAEADLVARAGANAIEHRVHIQITKAISYRGGARLRKGLVIAAQRDGSDRFYVVLDRTASGGSSGLSVPKTHAKELAL